jgi:hypothetical protein
MRNKYKGEDIKARLGGTIIRYKGIPVKVEVQDLGQLALFSLEGHGLIASNVDPEDVNIDISSLTLGYLNIDHPDYKLAVYLKREPARQYRQGIDVQRLTQTVLRSNGAGVHPKILEGKCLVDCVANNYPSFSQAMKLLVEKGFFSVALSRDVAVQREYDKLKVFVKEIEVGYVRMGTKKVIVPTTDTSCYAIFFLSDIKDWDIQEGNK